MRTQVWLLGQAALKGLSDKPVRFVLNTHWHFDHTGGNKEMGKASTIIAHDNVRKRLAEGNPNMLGMNIPPAPKVALPVITFDQSLTVHVNGEDIRALHYARGHTDGDSVVFFPQSNVVHLGDDFVTYGFPFVDVKADVKKFTAMLSECVGLVREAQQKGQTLEQMKAANVLAKHDALGQGFVKTPAFIELIYNELQGQAGKTKQESRVHH
jgi:cyclase